MPHRVSKLVRNISAHTMKFCAFFQLCLIACRGMSGDDDGLNKTLAKWAASRGGVHQQLEFQLSCGHVPPVPPPRTPSILAGRLCELYALGREDTKVTLRTNCLHFEKHSTNIAFHRWGSVWLSLTGSTRGGQLRKPPTKGSCQQSKFKSWLLEMSKIHRTLIQKLGLWQHSEHMVTIQGTWLETCIGSMGTSA